MKEKNKSINDLYFGVVMPPISYSGPEERMNLKIYNLFDFNSIKKSVARYVVMSEEERKKVINPLLFCFSDVWSRTEFEVIVCPWPFTEKDTISNSGKKMDIYSLYVLPNADLLMDMVEGVSVPSAKKYLAEERKKRKC